MKKSKETQARAFKVYNSLKENLEAYNQAYQGLLTSMADRLPPLKEGMKAEDYWTKANLGEAYRLPYIKEFVKLFDFLNYTFKPRLMGFIIKYENLEALKKELKDKCYLKRKEQIEAYKLQNRKETNALANKLNQLNRRLEEAEKELYSSKAIQLRTFHALTGEPIDLKSIQDPKLQQELNLTKNFKVNASKAELEFWTMEVKGDGGSYKGSQWVYDNLKSKAETMEKELAKLKSWSSKDLDWAYVNEDPSVVELQEKEKEAYLEVTAIKNLSTLEEQIGKFNGFLERLEASKGKKPVELRPFAEASKEGVVSRPPKLTVKEITVKKADPETVEKAFSKEEAVEPQPTPMFTKEELSAYIL